MFIGPIWNQALFSYSSTETSVYCTSYTYTAVALANVCGGCSVLWRIFSTVEDVGTLGDVQYCGGCSVLWRMFSTVAGYHQYYGGYSVL